jgi:hypothetical protein
MATTIYESGNVTLLDNKEIYMTPLKIRYLREFMDLFDDIKNAKNDNEALTVLTNCTLVAMKQYYPEIKTVEQLEDIVNVPMIYRIIKIAANIDIKNKDENVKEQAEESGSTWDTLDLARLEAEVFLLGIWKDYAELELSMSMPELMETLKIKRETDYNDKKFMAAMKGINLDEQTGKQDEWQKLKAKVFSRGATNNPDDILSLQGANASKAGFGIGLGLEYERIQ